MYWLCPSICPRTSRLIPARDNQAAPSSSTKLRPPTGFVFNFAQTPQRRRAHAYCLGRGQRRVAMKDVQRYRLNAAECLSAAERCELPYRGLTLAIAASWLSLARQQEAMVELLAIWGDASSATSTVSSPHSFILSTFTSPHPPLPPAGGYVAIPVGGDSPKALSACT
jgi:hypothetical protein